MSKFIFAVLKKKSILVPNGDKTRYVIISGCPTESVNGTYYQMDPITINDRTIYLCFTNGIYIFEANNLWCDFGYLYEVKNSKFTTIFRFVSGGGGYWYDSITNEGMYEMTIEKIGFNTGGY